MNKPNIVEVNDVVIRFSGDSGDGMQLTGTLFSESASSIGNDISTFPDYPAEIRAPQGTIAGVSGFQVHFSNHKISTPGDYCDLLVAMNPAALKANVGWLKPGATVLVDADQFTEANIRKAGFTTGDPVAELKLEAYSVAFAPVSSMTKEALSPLGLDAKTVSKTKNMFALGVCYYLYNRSLEYTEQFCDAKFQKKNPLLAAANKLALNAGYNYAANSHLFANTYKVSAAEQPAGTYRSINGNQATAWGFIAAAEKSGRPLFCGSYPITPATVILEELALRRDLGVKTMQCEDEIAGICTTIGAAFAGHFAVTTTSGPGLSLKSEAMGLAVITELPIVVVDVQRAGPSTGIPTKTEQTDLYQALWGRNGECLMVVLAASTPSDCFDWAFTSGKIAMEHMTPVLLLTDGYLGNGSEPWRIPSMADYPEIKPPVLTQVPEGGYKPYVRNPENLARYWALPGTPGMEHRIGGLEKDFITGAVSANPVNHQKMVDVRAEKVARVADVIPDQQVTGDASGDVLVVGWGGTYGHLATAVKELRAQGKSVSHCHFNYINPLPKNVRDIFKNYKTIVVCELNRGQFAGYLRMNFQEFTFEQYNKVQGQPFTVNELTEYISRFVK